MGGHDPCVLIMLGYPATLPPGVGAIRSGMKFMFVAEGGDRAVSKINQTEVSAEAALVFGDLRHCFLGQ